MSNKDSYASNLQKALESYVDASDALASLARNNKLSDTHREYAQGVIAKRNKQLKKEMDYEPTEFKVELPSAGNS
jgi:hypothetical protein